MISSNFRNKLLFLLSILISESFSWEKQEHQFLADLVLDSTLSFCEIGTNDSLIFFPGKAGYLAINKKFWNHQSFGSISAVFSGNDISQSHCHLKGCSIKQQLEPLSVLLIDEVWNRIKETPNAIQSVEVSGQSVVFNYLLYHLMALRLANISGNENNNEFLRYALIYEAAAHSYLSDSFSAGHLLLLVSDFLAPLNFMNVQIAHDYYSFEGVYVINSLGDCWRTFGDKLLQWYPYSFKQVYEACKISLLELLLVYFTSSGGIKIPSNLEKWAGSIAGELTLEELSNSWLTSNSGVNYYAEIRTPSLLRIPIPVSAVWSMRTMTKDEHGIFLRKNYPQLIDENYHDQDLTEIDTDFLYSRNSMPDWLTPGFLPNDTLRNIIKYYPDIASVRYIQNRFLPPPYQGYLLSVGGAYVYSGGRDKFGAALCFGWGFTDEFIFILIKPSFFISALKFFKDNEELILMADIGVGLNIPLFRIIKPHLEIGYAYGFRSPFDGSAGKFALGFDSETLPLEFTYAGLTFRFKYQFIFFNKPFHFPMLEIILH